MNPIEKLKALEANARPGPWHPSKSPYTESTSWLVYRPDPAGGTTAHTRKADADLTAALRNLAPEILAVLEVGSLWNHSRATGNELVRAIDAFEAKAAALLEAQP
ncbi:hypothetical protein [Mesoterricola sediminis]|uniref:Uncharacterized protein n=1 Tax=Mesoterricola sediminis TaxID=2927980 RepID=A0AA48H5B3_9BACT|nr:hypothetical protein [Mesoterricola sediminis]BDU76243.1 hypothetical protein METESE_12010 [Mesoterricola sediminis]